MRTSLEIQQQYINMLLYRSHPQADESRAGEGGGARGLQQDDSPKMRRDFFYVEEYTGDAGIYIYIYTPYISRLERVLLRPSAEENSLHLCTNLFRNNQRTTMITSWTSERVHLFVHCRPTSAL